MPDFKVTPNERTLVANAQSDPENRRKYLERFWRSRLQKKDPIPRIGFAIWCESTQKLKNQVANGDKEYWNHRGYRYWNFMAHSTVINLAVGLDRAGFEGDFEDKRRKIEAIGAKIAKRHIEWVTLDYRNRTGKVPGLLSLRQLARYHHNVFEEEGIPSHFYGGTYLESVPNQWEFEAYGDWYCHDCDPHP